MGVRELVPRGTVIGVRDVLGAGMPYGVVWVLDHLSLIVAVGLAAATVALVVWRLLARRNHADLSSGIATVALAVTAVVVPACLALWWGGATGGAFWWTVAVALTAAALASTEWLRAALRGFAVLAIVALAAMLLRLGWENLDGVRCTEVHDLAADVKKLDQAKPDLLDAATATANDARTALGRAVRANAAAPRLLAPAQRLVVALETADAAGLRDATRELDKAYRPNAASRGDEVLLAAADRAVGAAQAVTALQGVESPATVTSLDKEACGDRQRLVTDVELAGARSATATYRNRLQPKDEIKAAAAKKAATAADDAAERAAQGEADEGTDWVNVVKRGATVAGSAALGWLPGSAQPDKWFWVVLAGLLLGAWWLVERRSASTVAGPVNVTFQGVAPEEADKAKQPAKEAQQALFVTALTKNLREPGSTPGSPATSPITDLESIVTAAGPPKVLAAVITALKKVFSSPRGSTVTAQVLAPLPSDKGWRVLVVVADAATGRTVASKEHVDDSGAEACRVAGYWASAVVLSASPRIPLWARWSPATARAFAAYDTATEPTVDALWAALHEAPASGLVLHKLADKLSLDGKYADAAELYARAVVVDPTDFNAVYRLAATLPTLATLVSDQAPWDELPYSRRAAAVELLNRAADRAQVSARVDGGATPAQQHEALKELAGALFERLHDTLGPRTVVVRYFRRDQRDAIGPLAKVFSKYGQAAQWRAALLAARLSVGAFKSTPIALKETEAIAIARDSRSGWQVCYNLACYYALKHDGTAAITWLEIALTRPGVEDLGAWLEKDPDLKALHGLPRFVRLRNLFASHPEES